MREQVLVKAKKLEPTKLEIILQRVQQRQGEQVFQLLRQDWEAGRPFDPERWRLLAEDRRPRPTASSP